MRTLLLRFVNDQSAATAIEYGLIAAGISIAIIAVVNGLGTNRNTCSLASPVSLTKRSFGRATKGRLWSLLEPFRLPYKLIRPKQRAKTAPWRRGSRAWPRGRGQR